MTDANAQGLGTVLREARQAAGMSEQQVADTLRLSPAIVRTLEANDFRSLPAPAYTRGYIRAYARLLGLDADALLCKHEQCLGSAQMPRLVIRDHSRTPLRDMLHDRLGWVFGGAALAVVLVASVVLWWAWPQEGAASVTTSPSGQSTDQASSDALPSTPNAVTTPALQGANEAPSLAAAAPVPEIIAPDGAALPASSAPDGDFETAGVGGAPAESAAAANAEVDFTAAPLPAAGQGRALRFSFTEDCWVEVSDRMDRTLHRALNRAGETLLLYGETPLRIKLGNAPGVTLEYDGHAVALVPHTRNRVANLVLE